MDTEAHGGRKLLVTLLGALAGLCLALMLQQAGTVPLDRLAAFGLPAVVAGASLVMVIVRTRFARTITEWIAIVIVLILVVAAATGVPALAASDTLGGSSGFLDGGCTVSAASDVDSISDPGDTSRSDPFVVDPDGNISWDATSPAPFTDHTWEIWVDVGGSRVPVASGGDDNSGLSQTNNGDEPVRPRVDEISSRIGGDPAGIYLVGGRITSPGVGECVGQGWVELPGGVFSNAVGQGATGLFLLVTFLIIVLVIKVQRTIVEEVVTRTATSGGPNAGDGPSDDDLLGGIGGGDGAMQ